MEKKVNFIVYYETLKVTGVKKDGVYNLTYENFNCQDIPETVQMTVPKDILDSFFMKIFGTLILQNFQY